MKVQILTDVLDATGNLVQDTWLCERVENLDEKVVVVLTVDHDRVVYPQRHVVRVITDNKS